jgi:hypothetical protein
MRMPEPPLPTGWPVRFVALSVLVALAVWILMGTYPPAGPVDTSVIIPGLRPSVWPEPAETFTFVTIAALLPLLVLASVSRAFDRWWPLAMQVMVAALFAWPLLGGEVASVLVHGAAATVHIPVRTWVVCTALAVLLFFLPGFRKGRKGVFAVLVAVLIVDVACWRLIGTTIPDTDMHWPNHADPVFYPIAQVLGGMTLLADLPSQYGMYPELMAPLFRVLPVSLFSVGLLFALLQILATGALLLVLAQRLRNAVLLAITGLALIVVTAENNLMLAGMRELYLQYWPTRYLWPAISVLAFHWYLQKPETRRTIVFGVMAGVAALWNADSGVVVVLAFAGYLLARIFTNRGRRIHAIALAVYLGSVAATIAIVLLLLRIKGGPLHVEWLWEYQRIFAGLGLMAFPMPRAPHDWMATIAVYVLALVIAAEAWGRGAGDRADLLFFLGLLGIGLFAYYVSRSVVFNFMSVMWPAMVIAALLCDSALTQFQRSRRYAPGLPLAVVGIAGLAVGAFSLIFWQPKFLSEGRKVWSTFAPPGQSIIDQEIAFLRRHIHPGQRCVIAARRQGVYHLATETSSPIKGPALTEAVLVRDQQAFVDQVLDGSQPCLIFGAGPASAGLPITLDQLRQHYRVLDKTSTGSLLFMRPLATPAK